MTKIKAVIFDLDGVLINSLPFHYQSLKKLFSEYGIKYSFEEYIKNDITAGAMNIIPRIIKEHRKELNMDSVINKRKIDFRMLLEKKNHLAGKYPIKLYPGVLNLLKNLEKNGYKMAVASGGTRYFVNHILKKNRIDKYFDAIVTGEDHVKRKPHPDIFLKASRRLKVKPAQCLVVEDSHDGVIAAKRAKMKVIGHYNPKYKQYLSKADKVVRRMTGINVKIIERL